MMNIKGVVVVHGQSIVLNKVEKKEENHALDDRLRVVVGDGKIGVAIEPTHRL